MTDVPARRLPLSLTGAARSAAPSDDIGDVLASIRRLIAQEDGGNAPAATVTPATAAPFWTASAPTLRASDTAALSQAVDAASARMEATAQRAESARQAGMHAPQATPAPSLPDADTVSGEAFAARPARAGMQPGDAHDAPLRLRPDALIPPARPVPRPEGRLRLLSVLGTAPADATPDPTPVNRTGVADGRGDGGIPARASATGTRLSVDEDAPAVPLIGFAVDDAMPPRDPAGAPPAAAAESAAPPDQTVSVQAQGGVTPVAAAALPDDSPAPIAIHTAATDAPDSDPSPRAAEDAPTATAEPPQSGAVTNAANLRGLLRAAIRQELACEIDRLVTGPLHRLIRAEVARAVAEVFGDADRGLHR